MNHALIKDLEAVFTTADTEPTGPLTHLELAVDLQFTINAHNIEGFAVSIFIDGGAFGVAVWRNQGQPFVDVLSIRLRPSGPWTVARGVEPPVTEYRGDVMAAFLLG